MVYRWLRCRVLFCNVPWLAQDSGWFVSPGTALQRELQCQAQTVGNMHIFSCSSCVSAFEMTSPCIARDDLPWTYSDPPSWPPGSWGLDENHAHLWLWVPFSTAPWLGFQNLVVFVFVALFVLRGVRNLFLSFNAISWSFSVLEREPRALIDKCQPLSCIFYHKELIFKEWNFI